MNTEHAKKLAAEALAQLSEDLAAGRSDRLVRYLETMARFHRYSFGNVFLILSQRPDATHVAGFNSWRHLGRFVKKGEKGIAIFAPMMVRPRTGDESSGEERDTRRVLRFRIVHVFDVTQTDGEPLPEPVHVGGDPGDSLDRLRALVTERGITLDTEELPFGAEGVSRGGRISIRPGLEPARTFAVLTHELAHELLHRGDDRPASKTVRETEAEAVAFVVCRSICLATSTASSDYIQLYDGSPETLAGSLDRVQKVAAEILAGLTSSLSPMADA